MRHCTFLFLNPRTIVVCVHSALGIICLHLGSCALHQSGCAHCSRATAPMYSVQPMHNHVLCAQGIVVPEVLRPFMLGIDFIPFRKVGRVYGASIASLLWLSHKCHHCTVPLACLSTGSPSPSNYGTGATKRLTLDRQLMASYSPPPCLQCS